MTSPVCLFVIMFPSKQHDSSNHKKKYQNLNVLGTKSDRKKYLTDWGTKKLNARFQSKLVVISLVSIFL